MTPRTLRLSDGLAVGAIEAGPGAGRAGGAVLLLHGVGLCAAAWEPQMAALARAARVVAVDLPGHGGSDALPGTPALPDYVAWAARVVAALDAGPVAVAGHSMGALIAAGLAVDHADSVTRVALLCPVHRRSAAARAAVLARADEIASGLAPVDAPLARWFTGDEADLRDRVAGWLADVPRAGYAAAYRAFAGGDATYADRLSAIRCPLLALTAAGDANSTPAMTQAIAAAVPRGRAVVIGGHRHMVPLTAPETVSAALMDWLAPVGAAA